MKLHYFSESRGEWVEIATMATRHLENAAKKLEVALVSGDHDPAEAQQQLGDIRTELARRAAEAAAQ